MKLVEIVVALDTSPSTLKRATAFVEELQKRPIETKDRSGFIVNMLLIPYLMAAVRMYAEGFASREDIDMGMKFGCGHPMGPLTLCDFIGLDVVYAISNSLVDELQARGSPAPLRSGWSPQAGSAANPGAGSTITSRAPRRRSHRPAAPDLRGSEERPRTPSSGVRSAIADFSNTRPPAETWDERFLF